MNTYRPDHNGECLHCDEPLDAHVCPTAIETLTADRDFWDKKAGDEHGRALQLAGLASHLLDMVERVEWVRQDGGRLHACPFCHAISDRDGGPGHTDDCEWIAVSHAGNDLRQHGVLD